MKQVEIKDLKPCQIFKQKPESEKEYMFLGAFRRNDGITIYASYRAGASPTTGFYTKYEDKQVFIYE